MTDQADLPAPARRVRDALRAAGLEIEIVATGVSARTADEAAVRAATGYAIGGIPPLGHATPIAVRCDEDLLGYEVVWAAAGTPHHVFPIAPAELVRVTGAAVGQLAERPA